eukprot:TRINITY_DN6844_c0_g1_i5.p1 TRINITY_DN6844_c0_g1~~TRINITY_DN6844_c0_g1_i5.p1  ORF type:complete len:145 (-),score=37.35 TRINITY_DN6844_c0_g1_i5:3-437(-)
MSYVSSMFFFFFQAEDGIRDVERSRGLGDVYKRQIISRIIAVGSIPTLSLFDGTETLINKLLPQIGLTLIFFKFSARQFSRFAFGYCNYPMYSALIPVSYTHLTLPTILLVQISVVAVSLKKKTKQEADYVTLLILSSHARTHR